MNNKSNYKIKIIIVLSLFLILVSNSFTITNAQTLNNKPLKIGLTQWVPNYLAYIAQGKGYFKKNNVDVNLTLIRNYGDAINDYSTGVFDGIFIVYSDAIIQQSSGVDTKVVYNLDSCF
jgi:NitT/TauT family transport system substrate-binding protein